MTGQRTLFTPAAKPIVLRPYQQGAIDAVYGYLRTKDDNPVVVLPTGSGKTPVLATLCRDVVKQWSGRAIVLAHVKELLQQAADKLQAICPDVPVGLFSAGLNRREAKKPVTVAGIQSIYKRACELDPFDIAFVDEAHLIGPDGDGMYQQFLADAKVVNPQLRVVGLTATPFRMKSGPICTPDGILNAICYEVGVRELIVDGYLSPLISKGSETKVDFSDVGVRAGEFAESEVEALMDVDEVVISAAREIVAHAAARKSCLVFACGKQHAKHIAAAIESLLPGTPVGLVFGETSASERDRTLEAFKAGELKYLVNVNVLTTGFDATGVDLVALVRPTMSPGLYYQMVGRGFRLHPGKKDCLVLDFGGNVLRHGPVDRIVTKDAAKGRKSGESPAKECPQCKSLIAAGYSSCPDCGHEFVTEAKPKHEPQASTDGILSGQVSTEVFEVERTFWSVHKKKGAFDGDPRTLRVDYLCAGGFTTKSEWICLEHGGWAKGKAVAWWQARSNDPCPDDIETAVAIAEGGGLAETLSITVRTVSGEKFDRIIDYKLGDKPEAIPLEERQAAAASWDDDIPF